MPLAFVEQGAQWQRDDDLKHAKGSEEERAQVCIHEEEDKKEGHDGEHEVHANQLVEFVEVSEGNPDASACAQRCELVVVNLVGRLQEAILQTQPQELSVHTMKFLDFSAAASGGLCL